MSYTPIADTDINAPLAGNDDVWTTLVANDVLVWDAYEPAFEANPLVTSSTAAREHRFRVRGGDSLVGSGTARMSFSVGVRGVTSGGGTTTVSVRMDDTSVADLSVVALDWYDSASINLVHSAEPREVVVSSAATGGNTLAYHGIRCIYAAGSSSGLYAASGWCKVGSFWSTADRAVPSDVVSRLRANPIAIARSRPVCVAFHCVDTVLAVSNKATHLWGVENETSYQVVGRLQVPYADREERTYIVDAYVTESIPGTGEFTVRVGATAETWTGPGWHSWTVTISGSVSVVATINPGTTNKAAIRTFQVWRMEGTSDGRSIASEGASSSGDRRSG